MISALLTATQLTTPALAASRPNSFTSRLVESGPAPDRTEKMALYGWLIGDWTMTSVLHASDRSTKPGPAGEIHAAWTLEGRAIQDVWILPGFFYGTTLRVFDSALDAWHIIWTDPFKQYFTRQLGRPDSNGIMQVGKEDDGTPVRWSFSEISGDTFRWRAERSDDCGVSWRTQIEFYARRAAVR